MMTGLKPPLHEQWRHIIERAPTYHTQVSGSFVDSLEDIECILEINKSGTQSLLEIKCPRKISTHLFVKKEGRWINRSNKHKMNDLLEFTRFGTVTVSQNKWTNNFVYLFSQ